jgi:anti-anti-sigma factor
MRVYGDDLASVTLLFQHDGPVRVAVTGELDLSNAPVLYESAQWALSVEGVTAVEIDLSELVFLDAVGISSLVATAREVRDSGRTLRVTGATGMVAEVLRLTGVELEWAPPVDAGPGQRPPSRQPSGAGPRRRFDRTDPPAGASV